MKKLLFILPIVLLFACKKNQTRLVGVPGPTHVMIFFKNSAGQDLLNSATPNAVDPLKIQLLDLNEAGKKIHYINPNPLSDYPKGFRLMQDGSGINFMYVSYDGGIKIGNKITRYLRFEDGSEDKITFEVINPIYIENLWINDILKATRNGSNVVAPVEIVK